MKVLLVSVLAWMSLWNLCTSKMNAADAVGAKASSSGFSRADSVQSIEFARDIQPILQKRCSPCHFTGGKMYEKLPFDKGETILSHPEGILRRIKEDPDAQKIKDYIRQHAKEKEAS